MGITDIQLPSNGTSLPIVRYVYLVQDASDATRMLGTTNNVYTTFQTAYDAANVLQTALGGINKVLIKVGNTTAATVGNVVLTTDWNVHVGLAGISPSNSIVGNITLSNAAGNAYNFGSGTGVFISNITLGNITVTATGATGNAGNIIITMDNIKTGNLVAYPTNATNATGNSGTITLQSTSFTSCQVGNIQNCLFCSTSTATTGALTVIGFGRIKAGAIRTGASQYPGSAGGAINLKNVDCSLISRYTYQDSSITHSTIATDIVINDDNIILTSDIDIRIENTNTGAGGVSGGIALGSATTGFTLRGFLKNVTTIGFIFLNVHYIEIANSQSNNPVGYAIDVTGCTFVRILNCSFSSIDDYTGPIVGTNAVIYTDDTLAVLNLIILNSSLLGGTNAVESAVAVTIYSGSTYFEVPVDANTTITPLTLDV